MRAAPPAATLFAVNVTLRIAVTTSAVPRGYLTGLPLQFKAVKYAIEHGRLTRPDYERIAGVARATANRDLIDLTKRGVLRQGGAARGALTHGKTLPKRERGFGDMVRVYLLRK